MLLSGSPAPIPGLPGSPIDCEERPPDWWPYQPEFPDWHVWRGVAGLLYARRLKSSPPKVVRALAPQGQEATSPAAVAELRDQIRLAQVPR